MNLLRHAVAALLLSTASSFLIAAEAASVPASVLSTPSSDANYESVIDKRTSDIVALLNLTDDATRAAVHSTIMTQYRSLNAWHEANGERRKVLRKQVGKSEEATPEKKELDTIDASLKELHNWYLTSLGKHLTPEQIDVVKDKMTYGKVQVTYNAYLAQQPTLTEEHKAYLLEQLKLAREEAIDGGSAEEKSAIFDRYKGRINNWLVKNGYELGGKKKPSTQPAK